jgi:hypothetical protein
MTDRVKDILDEWRYGKADAAQTLSALDETVFDDRAPTAAAELIVPSAEAAASVHAALAAPALRPAVTAPSIRKGGWKVQPSKCFKPPPPGTPMCQHLVVYGPYGRLPEPRPCKRAAEGDSPYCVRHQQIAEKTPPIEVREGGFCVACAMPGRSYVLNGVTISLCETHGRSLERAIREGR